MINRLTRCRIKRFRKKYYCEIWGEAITKEKLNRSIARYLQTFDYKYRLYCNAKLELYLKRFYKKGQLLKKRFRFEHENLLINKKPIQSPVARRQTLFWGNFYSYYSSMMNNQQYYTTYDYGFLQNLLLRRWVFYRKRRYHTTKLKRWKKHYPRIFPPKFSYTERDRILLTQIRYFYLCFDKNYFKKMNISSRALIAFEYTLVVFLFRLNLVYNMFQARRFIILGWVTVNGKTVRNYNYRLKIGDMVSFTGIHLKTILLHLKKKTPIPLNIPNYVLADYKTLTFLIWRAVEVKDIVSPINIDPLVNSPLGDSWD